MAIARSDGILTSLTFVDYSGLLSVNLREIAELAVLTSWHSHIDSSTKVPDERLACYIRYTRLRTHVWHLCVEQLQKSPAPQLFISLYQEVLVSELLAQTVRYKLLKNERNIGQRMAENVTSIRRILEGERKTLPSFVQALKIERLNRRLEQWLEILTNDELESEVDYAVALASIRIAIPDMKINDERRSAVQRAVCESVLDLIVWQHGDSRQNQLRNIILSGSTCN